MKYRGRCVFRISILYRSNYRNIVAAWHYVVYAYSLYCITVKYLCVVVLGPQSFHTYLYGTKNQHGHRVCWMSTGNKTNDMYVKNRHITIVAGTTAVCKTADGLPFAGTSVSVSVNVQHCHHRILTLTLYVLLHRAINMHSTIYIDISIT